MDSKLLQQGYGIKGVDKVSLETIEGIITIEIESKASLL